MKNCTPSHGVQPRHIASLLDDYVNEPRPACHSTTGQAEAELLRRVGKRVKRNRLWSLGTEPEQLELDQVERSS